MRKAIFVLILCCFTAFLGVRAQTTATGNVVSYNETTASAILSVTAQDFRFNQMPEDGGIVSVTVGDVTREAFLISAERLQSLGDDVVTTILLSGFDPNTANNPLVYILAPSISRIQHLDATTNPLTTFQATIGDPVRVNLIAPPPTPVARDVAIPIAEVEADTGNLMLDLSENEAAALGLFTGVRGRVILNGQETTFALVQQENYDTTEVAGVMLFATEEGGIAAWPNFFERETTNLASDYGVALGDEIQLLFDGFTYAATSAGTITAIDGQTLTTDIPASYIEENGLMPGRWAILIVNGILRAGLVMDADLYAAAQTPIGLSSNYVVLQDGETLSIVYLQDDGRQLADIFDAEVGTSVWLRPSVELDPVVNENVIVKAVSEIAPEGFLYIDVTPFELSFLEVLVGQFVNVDINGIRIRSQVVDDSVVPDPSAAILVVPGENYMILSQQVGDNLTAETRFQASVGNPVIIQRAPN